MEIYGVDISLAQLASGPGERAAAILRLHDIAADAERRHWLSWALDARLAALRLTSAQGDQAATARLAADLQRTAREHGFRRILTLSAGITDIRPSTD